MDEKSNFELMSHCDAVMDLFINVGHNYSYNSLLFHLNIQMRH